jgi:hypothetical protein
VAGRSPEPEVAVWSCQLLGIEVPLWSLVGRAASWLGNY